MLLKKTTVLDGQLEGCNFYYLSFFSTKLNIAHSVCFTGREEPDNQYQRLAENRKFYFISFNFSVVFHYLGL